MSVHITSATQKGGRKTQEDSVLLYHLGDIYMIGVMDGHASPDYDGKKISEAVVQAMMTVGDKLTSEMFTKPKQFREFLTQNSFNIDQWLLKTQPKNAIDAGSTAVMGLYDAKTNTFYTFNVGDSRIIYFEIDGAGPPPKKVLQSLDHKPNLQREIDRIEEAGGVVRTSKSESSVARVDGVLALSRSFGDFQLKQPYNNSVGDWVTVKPDIKGPFHPKGEFFAAAASDGVWDQMKSKEVAQMLSQAEPDASDLKKVCSKIVAENIKRWIGSGADNVSISALHIQ